MPSERKGLSFINMVVGTMALLKLKGKYDEYRQANSEEEYGRVALTSPSVDNLPEEGHMALLDTEIPRFSRRPIKKKACCMCCGMDCSLLWKAIGIVVGLSILWSAFKAVRWALTDPPTGLEEMPAFSTSLGCLSDAPYIYNKTELVIHNRIGSLHSDHSFDARGYGVGTISIADGDVNSTEVKYEITIRANKEDGNDDIAFVYPDISADDVVTRSRFIIDTSHLPGVDDWRCNRFDVKMYIPPGLKRLNIASHTTAQVKLAPGSRFSTLDAMFVTLYTSDLKNIIVPSIDAIPKEMSLELTRGWIVGEATVSEELNIATQRGDGVANVKIYPAPPSDPTNPTKAILRTATGAGRSDFNFIGNKVFKIPIEGRHTSSRNADMYLTYRHAEFNGKIEMTSKSYTVTGAQRIMDTPDAPQEEKKWTHFVGDVNGEDTIYVNSRGWTGLYF